MVGLEKGITKEAVRMAWPAVCESFFIALAGMVDSLMVSSMGASAVAAVGLMCLYLHWWQEEEARKTRDRRIRFCW